MKFHAKYVSVGESGGEYFAVSFDNGDPSNDDFDLSGDEGLYLIVQRQFEDDDGASDINRVERLKFFTVEDAVRQHDESWGLCRATVFHRRCALRTSFQSLPSTVGMRT
jgi:hypothetical protein